MKREKRIEINAAIFPYIIRIALSKPLTKDSDAEAVDTPSSSPEIPDIMIDLPRGAYLLYLKNLAKEHNTLELRLLENYAYGVAFSDNDYEELLKLKLGNVLLLTISSKPHLILFLALILLHHLQEKVLITVIQMN